MYQKRYVRELPDTTLTSLKHEARRYSFRRATSHWSPAHFSSFSSMLPELPRRMIVEQAIVRWSRGHEFGLVIHAMKDQDRVRLRDFIAELL